MALGFKSVITGENPEIIIDLGYDVVVARHYEAPTDGVNGTLAGHAGPGSLLIVANGASSNIYQNRGTKDSPTWVAI